MAQSSLNQIVSNAAGAVTGPSGAAPNVQGIAQSLAPQSTGDLTSALTQAAQQVAGLVSTNQTLVDTLNLNTAAVQQGASQSSSGGSTASTVGSVASAVLGGGLGLIPLISSIAGLFGGGSSAPPTLTKYAAPAAVDATLADTPGATSGLSSFAGVVYGQNGLPQAAPQNPTQSQTTASSSSQQISIQVNAMDSQSFMDHSYEIAQAVRSAMLNMSSINDVVSTL
jgi:hypothetical protein